MPYDLDQVDDLIAADKGTKGYDLSEVDRLVERDRYPFATAVRDAKALKLGPGSPTELKPDTTNGLIAANARQMGENARNIGSNIGLGATRASQALVNTVFNPDPDSFGLWGMDQSVMERVLQEQEARANPDGPTVVGAVAQGVGALPAMLTTAVPAALAAPEIVGGGIAAQVANQALKGAAGFGAARGALAPENRLKEAAIGAAEGAAMGPISLIPGAGAAGEVARRATAAGTMGGLAALEEAPPEQVAAGAILGAALQGRTDLQPRPPTQPQPAGPAVQPTVPPSRQLGGGLIEPEPINVNTGTRTGPIDKINLAAERLRTQGIVVEVTPSADGKTATLRATVPNEKAGTPPNDTTAKTGASPETEQARSRGPQAKEDAGVSDAEPAGTTAKQKATSDTGPDFLDRAADAARERVKTTAESRLRGETLQGGLTPAETFDFAIIGAQKLRNGIRDRVTWEVAMQRELGDSIKPYLPRLWDRSSGMAQGVFYSKMRDSIAEKFPDKGTADSYTQELLRSQQRGEFKQAELDDSTLLPWLMKQKGPVTRADIIQHLDENAIELHEVTRRELPPEAIDEIIALEKGLEAYRQREGVTRDMWLAADANIAQQINAVRARYGNEPTFGKWTLPGGENYREVILTLPRKLSVEDRVSSAMEAFNTGGRDANLNAKYTSPHFPEIDNPIAHFRLTERIVDGKRTLFIEEIQSDLHQKGRKEGYQNPELLTALDTKLKSGEPLTSAEQADYNRLTNLEAFPSTEGGAPDLPFKKNWHELGMRRMLQMAADEGFERVAWTTGDQQAARYNYDPGDKGMGDFYDKILVNYVNSFAKKWGGRVGKREIITSTDMDMSSMRSGLSRQAVHSIDLTAPMAKTLKTQPITLYSFPGPIFESGAKAMAKAGRITVRAASKIASEAYERMRNGDTRKMVEKMGLAWDKVVRETAGPEAVLLRRLRALSPTLARDHDLLPDYIRNDYTRFTNLIMDVVKPLPEAHIPILEKYLSLQRLDEILASNPDYIDPVYTPDQGQPYKTGAVVKDSLGNFAGDHNLTNAEFALIDSVAQDYHDLMHQYTIEALHIAERLSGAEYVRLLNKGQMYVPRSGATMTDNWRSIFDPLMQVDGAANRWGVRSSGLLRQEDGSFDPIRTDALNLFVETAARVAAGNRRNALLADAHQEAGLSNNEMGFSQVPKEGYSAVPFMAQGKVENVYIDNYMLEDFLRLNPLIVTGSMKFTRAASKGMKFFITGPGNPIRFMTDEMLNTASAYLLSDASQPVPAFSTIPPVFAAEFALARARTMKDAFTRTGAAEEFLKQGGMVTLSDEWRAQQHALVGKGVKGPVSTVKKVLRWAEIASQYINDTIELWTRLAIRDQLIRKGVSPEDASYQALAYLNYGKGGNFIRGLDNRGFMYLNPTVQVLRALAATTTKHPGRFAAKVGQVVAGFIAAQLAYFYFQDQMDPTRRIYNQHSDHERINNMFLHFGTPVEDKKGNQREFYYKARLEEHIAFLHALALTASIPAYNKMFGGNVRPISGEALAQSASRFFFSVPTAASVPWMRMLVGTVANYDPFTGAPIYKGDKNLPTAQQGTTEEEAALPGSTAEPTSPVAMALGNPVISPAMMEFLADSIAGSSPYYGLFGMGAEKLLRAAPTPEERKSTFADFVDESKFLKPIIGFSNKAQYYQTPLLEAKRAADEKDALRMRKFKEVAGQYFAGRSGVDKAEVETFIASPEVGPDMKQRYMGMWLDWQRWAAIEKSGLPKVAPSRIPGWQWIKDSSSVDSRVSLFHVLYTHEPKEERLKIRKEIGLVFGSQPETAGALLKAANAIDAAVQP